MHFKTLSDWMRAPGGRSLDTELFALQIQVSELERKFVDLKRRKQYDELYNEYLKAKRDGKTHKRWISELGETTRTTHRAVHRRLIPIDDYLIVGGERLFLPSDPRASFAQTANCGCAVVFEGGEKPQVVSNTPVKPKQPESQNNPESKPTQNSPPGAGSKYGITPGEETFMGLPYGSRIPSKNPGATSGFRRANTALSNASDEIRKLAKEYYAMDFRTGQQAVGFSGRMLPEVGAEIRELSNGRFGYKIIVGSRGANGNGATPFAVGDKTVVGRIHFHWTDVMPSEPDISNAREQSRLRGRDFFSAIGSYGGFSIFWLRGDVR